MLLTVSIGNTNTAFGLFDGEEPNAVFRLKSDRSRSTNTWNQEMALALTDHGMAPGDINRAILCSVVPAITPVLSSAIQRMIGAPPQIITSEFIHHHIDGFSIRYDPPANLGADRAVNAYAAHCLVLKSGGQFDSAIVVDCGTATTLGVVSEGSFVGGMILPGIGISTDALFGRTAQLNPPELRPPFPLIASNTADALRSGIIHGFTAQIDGLITRIKAELGKEKRILVLGTGGALPTILPYLTQIDYYEPDLALHGLGILAAWLERG